MRQVMSRDARGSYLDYHNDVRACEACSARADARTPVPGIGTVPIDIMVIGRNPGEQEDKIGIPFVGASGQIVDDWLWAAGLSRNTVFITNVVLCHTAANRIPTKPEVDECTKLWLVKTLDFVSPKLVLPLGALAAKLFGVPGSITKVSGHVFSHKRGFAVIPCIHPGGVLRNPGLRTVLEYTREVVAKYADTHQLNSKR